MKTSRTQIEKNLNRFRLKFQKAKDAYLTYLAPGSTHIVEKKREKSFRGQILKAEMDHYLKLITICRNILSDEVQK